MTKSDSWALEDYLHFGIIMSLMGGFYWAIRGTGGYGGETGAMLAGSGWAMWWYLASRRGADAATRPYGSAWAVVAITFGIAIGGFTGYGVWMSWLGGKFYYTPNGEYREIARWIGFFMLFLCGLQWGGLAGCFLSWCAPERPVSPASWGIRIACGVAGGVAATWFLNTFPQLHLPFYGEGIYDNPDWGSVQRTRNQIMPVGMHLGVVLGFLAFEAARRDWRAVKMIVTMMLGFGIPFAVGALWHLGNETGLRLGWWKHWEMSIGLGGGAAFGLAFWLFNRPSVVSRPALHPNAALFFAFGGPLWLVLLNNFQGVYDGLAKKLGAEPNMIGMAVLAVLCAVPVFVRWRGKRLLDLDANGTSVPLTPFVIVQTGIVVCGWLVTVDRNWALANWVIAGAYVVYLAGSVYCARRLWGRGR